MGLIISLVRSTLCHVPKRMDVRGGGSKNNSIRINKNNISGVKRMFNKHQQEIRIDDFRCLDTVTGTIRKIKKKLLTREQPRRNMKMMKTTVDKS